MVKRFRRAMVALICPRGHGRAVNHGRLMPAVHETFGQGWRAGFGALPPSCGNLMNDLREFHVEPLPARS
jgi:hypothetical protein